MTNMNSEQIRVLQKGLDLGIDISKFASIDYAADHMDNIIETIRDGYDPAKLLNPNLTFEEHTKITVMMAVEQGGLVLDENDLAELKSVFK